MKTKIELKDGVSICQPLTERRWTHGYIDGYCRAADDRCYAVVVTENKEFEFVPIHAIRAVIE